MKILLINSHHYIKGGADRVYFNTSALLEQKGHSVAHFSSLNPSNQPSKYSKYFAKFQDYRSYSTFKKVISVSTFLYNTEVKNNLITLLDDFKPDVAHIHLFYGGLSTSVLSALKKRGIPVVISVHDYRLLCPAYLFLDGNNKICEACKDKFFIRSAFKRCANGNFFNSSILALEAYFRHYVMNPFDYIDHFIFVSEFIRNKHIEFNQAYSDVSSCVYNFIPDLEKIVPSFEHQGYFLYYGRLSREKGIKTLINAAIESNILLKIVGNGELSDELKENIPSNIEFIGHKNGAELWNIIKGASFVVVPSEWYENNPMTVLESFAMGKPVIGARIGGIPELVKNGGNGYLFESGNKEKLKEVILKASSLDEISYKQLSINARKFAEDTFMADSHYKSLESIYNKLKR